MGARFPKLLRGPIRDRACIGRTLPQPTPGGRRDLAWAHLERREGRKGKPLPRVTPLVRKVLRAGQMLTPWWSLEPHLWTPGHTEGVPTHCPFLPSSDLTPGQEQA